MAYANYAELKAKKPFRWWYDAIIDWRLANPGRPEGEAAKHFGVTASYYSIIVNSDMFRARWEQRRRQHSEELGESVQKKMMTTLDLTLDIVQEQLRDKRAQLPFKDTTKFLNDTLEKLGYGPSKGTNVFVQSNGTAPVAVSVTQNDLAEARALLRRSQEARMLNAPPPAAEPARSAQEADQTPSTEVGEAGQGSSPILDLFPLEDSDAA